MKKQKWKFLCLGVFCLTLLFYNCSEDFENYEKTHTHENSKIKMRRITLNDIQNRKDVIDKINNASKIKNLNKNNLNRVINDTINNFSIDTEFGTLIEIDNTISYTFKVLRENGSSFLLENLVISKEGNNDYETYLYQYDINEQELEMINQDISIDLTNKISRITLENSNLYTNILGKEDYNGMCFVENTTYTSGQNCPNGHNWAYVQANINTSDQCTYLGQINGPIPGTYSTSATLQPCPTGGGGSGTGSGSGSSGGSTSGGGGGGGTGTVTTTPTNNCRECIPAYAPTPCDKVKNQFIDNPTLNSKLNTLSGLTSSSTERGFQKLTNSNIIQNASVGLSGAVELPDVPNGAKCTMFAHTHNSPAINTYSIFSWDDLIGIAKLIRLGKIDTNNFVTYLATADGTYYALTIENPTSFSQFFATISDSNYNPTVGLKMALEMNKYYDPGMIGNPIILENSTDNIKDEKAFLDFLNDNSLGTSLFESNSTFTTFEEVKHNKTTNTIDKQPCL